MAHYHTLAAGHCAGTYKKKLPQTSVEAVGVMLWALRDSNPRPSACKADALNQLS